MYQRSSAFSSFKLGFVGVLLLCPVLFGGKCKCKPDETDTVDTTPPPPPEIKLQVASIQPSSAEEGEAFPAKIFGSGIESGARVSIGGTSLNDVSMQSENELRVSVPAMSAGTYDIVVTNADGESATLSQALRIRKREITCKQVTVNFDYDRSNVRSDAQSILNGHMDCYTQLKGSINVEGHADERGTIEYNLALGERRASSVKRHLTSGGVTGSQIDTVSFGENKPVSTGSNEKAWAANRRAELYASE